MFHVVLYQPEIPPNTGNIIRLCANSGCQLHLIKPLGFSWNDKQLRRAGLDYHQRANVRLYESYAEYLDCWHRSPQQSTVYALTTKAEQSYSQIQFQAGDHLLFGPETRGLPQSILDEFSAQRRLRIPMLPDSRSLNLSNAAAIIVYEAWRQQQFAGGR